MTATAWTPPKGGMDAKALATKMGALKLPTMRVDQISPYENNPRKRTDEAIKKLADTISMVGFNVPIGVDEKGVILYGHGRRLAAIKIGLKIVPVLQIPGLTEQQKVAFRISDNRASEESEWDNAKLREELAELAKGLEGSEALLAATAFDLEDLSKWGDELGLTLPGEAETTVLEAKKPQKAEKTASERTKMVPKGAIASTIIDTGGNLEALCAMLLEWGSGPGGAVFSPFVTLEEAKKAAEFLERRLYSGPIDGVPPELQFDMAIAFPTAPSIDTFGPWSADYQGLLTQTIARLKPGGMVALLIGDVRRPDGSYLGLPWLTVEFALRAGATLSESAVFVMPTSEVNEVLPAGQLRLAHANLLVFRKPGA